MPEGHSVKRLALAFAELFAGQRVRVSSPQGRFAAGAQQLDGKVLTHTQAHGKHLFLGFSAEPNAPEPVHWWRVHLGLYGSWVFQGNENFHGAHAIGAPRRRVGERDTVLTEQSPPVGHEPAVAAAASEIFTPVAPVGEVRARIVGRNGCADLSGPTACEVITSGEKDLVHARLGPDPLHAEPISEPKTEPESGPTSGLLEFTRRVQRRKVPIGTLLMDQNVIAGVGNIYRAEALFRAGLDPMRPGHSVSSAHCAALWADLVVLMADGVRTGVIVTTQPQHRAEAVGGASAPQRQVRQNDREPHAGDRVPSDAAFYVYQRTGQPCRVCQAPIVESLLQQRKLYACPECQR